MSPFSCRSFASSYRKRWEQLSHTSDDCGRICTSRIVQCWERAVGRSRALRGKNEGEEKEITAPVMHFTRSCPESYSLLLEAYKTRQVITDTISSSLVPLTMKRKGDMRERGRRETAGTASFQLGEADIFPPNVPLMMSLITALIY